MNMSFLKQMSFLKPGHRHTSSSGSVEHSAIYKGWVRHRRLTSVSNELRYPLYMMLLDLDEVDAVVALHPLWSRSRWALSGFRASDYFGHKPTLAALKLHVQETFRTEGGLDVSRVEVLTNLSCLGFLMNPLSCYFGYNRDGDCVGMLAEVTNTPWGERYHYLLGMADSKPSDHAESNNGPDTRSDTCSDPHTANRLISPVRQFQREQTTRYQYRFNKAFHVSPFNPMDMEYQWVINPPHTGKGVNTASTLLSHMSLYHQGNKCFDATLNLQRHPISRNSLGQILLAYPLMSIKIALGIYWQAARLWLRGSRYYPHPRQSDASSALARSSNRETSDEIHPS
jgi:uncharacterized protein